MNLDFLLPIADVFVYVALLAWATTFVGLIKSLVRSAFPGTAPIRSIVSNAIRGRP